MTTTTAALEEGPIRVASVDDDTVIRDGLPYLLPRLEWIGQYASLEALLADPPTIDVLLLDLSMSAGTPKTKRLQGGAAVRAASAAGFSVLIYTNEPRRNVLAKCLSYGARGVVSKAEPMQAVERAIRAVAGGQVVLTQAMVGLTEVAERLGVLGSLTERQRQVLAGRARGESYANIAKRLHISERTAQSHWNQVAEKFQEFLESHSPADLERDLGIAPNDLLDDRPAAEDSEEEPGDR